MKRADVFGVEGKRGRPRRGDCMKRDLVGVEWRMRERDGGRGVEMIGGGVETVVKTGLVIKGKHKSTTSISASLTPEYREKENNRQPGLSDQCTILSTISIKIYDYIQLFHFWLPVVFLQNDSGETLIVHLNIGEADSQCIALGTDQLLSCI